MTIIIPTMKMMLSLNNHNRLDDFQYDSLEEDDHSEDNEGSATMMDDGRRKPTHD